MNTKITLPFWETIRRSFMYVLLNFHSFTKTCIVWFVILLLFEIVTNYPGLCGLNSSTCEKEILPNISMAMMSLAGVAIIVSFCREIVLKESNNNYLNIHFGIREMIYVGKSFIYVLIILAPSFLLGFVGGLIAGLTNTPLNTYLPILFILLFFGVIYSARLYLAFPAVAVDNKEIGFSQSFAITFGNANRLFWGQVIIMLPTFVLLLTLSVIYRAIGSDNFIIKLFFSALLMIFSFIDAGLKASFFAHIYQYFMYFYNKEKHTNKVVDVKE